MVGSATVSESACSPVRCCASRARTTRFEVPLAVGVPLMTPLEPKLTPSGSAPETIS
jgi:hypothetical protein